MIRTQLILFDGSFTTAERAGGIFFGECDFKMKNAVDFENLNVFDFIFGKRQIKPKFTTENKTGKMEPERKKETDEDGELGRRNRKTTDKRKKHERLLLGGGIVLRFI